MFSPVSIWISLLESCFNYFIAKTRENGSTLCVRERKRINNVVTFVS